MQRRVEIKGFMAAAMIAAVLAAGTPASAQDLVPVNDITGGSSVFVFRNSAKAAPVRYISRTRSKRTKSQRIESVRKVTRQYTALAKAAPRRVRTQTFDPNNLPAAVRTLPKDEASKIFAGVGEYYMDRDDFDNAIKFFRESVQLDAASTKAGSGLSEALALKGSNLLVKEDNAGARAAFEEALKYNPKNSPAYFGLAEVFSDLDQDTQAVVNYEKALENDKALTEIYVPLGILYYQQGEIAKAENLLMKAITNGGGADAQTQYFIGLIRHSQNRNNEALEAFGKAKQLDPTNAEVYYYSGETLARLNQNNEAVVEYTIATELRDNYFDAWFGLGSVQYELGNYAASIEAFRKAVRLKNNNIEAYINLGDANRQANKFNDAESAYNLAGTFIERTKDFSKDEAADVYSKIGFVIAKQCEINLKKGVPCRWPVAVIALEKASAITGNTVDTANLGWAYYSAARLDIANKQPEAARLKLEKAKVALEKAAYSSPKYIEGPLVNLGMTLTDLGDYAGAVDAFKRVVAKKPEWVFALNELGIAYRKQNNLKDAADTFRTAVKRDPKFAPAHYNLGETEFRNGNLGEAKKSWSALRKLGRPDLASQLELISGGAVRGG